MSQTRRSFLAGAAAIAAGSRLESAAAIERGTSPAVNVAPAGKGFDPWVEVDRKALEQNVAAVSERAGGRSLIAVAKNNAYGLGLEMAGPIFDRIPKVAGIAVVKAQEALQLRRAGVRKPILLMGLPEDDEAEALARLDVRLAALGDGDAERLGRIAAKARRRVGIHLYVDTGMGRMGYSWRRALPWAESLAAARRLRIDGCFTELTEEKEFDREQVARLIELRDQLQSRGISIGQLHAGSTAAVEENEEFAFLDLLRPGLALYGGLPLPEYRCSIRLRARVVRVDRLEPGDGVNYGRPWKATQPTWIAVLPLGHVDGFPTGAGKGAEVLIGDRMYRVISRVSASHTIIEVGSEPTVEVGDIATLLGPDHPALHPDTVARRAGSGVYNMFMHLSALLPRTVIAG